MKNQKMLYVLLKFSQNRLKKILFSSRLKKGQEKAKWPNYFISWKLFQKRPNGNPDWTVTNLSFHTHTWTNRLSLSRFSPSLYDFICRLIGHSVCVQYSKVSFFVVVKTNQNSFHLYVQKCFPSLFSYTIGKISHVYT